MRLPTAIVSLVCAALAAPAAAHADLDKYRTDLSAGTSPAPADAIPVRPALPPPPAHSGGSPDFGVEPSARLSRAAKRAHARADKAETFADPHGHPIAIATDNDAIDLRPFAEILAATYHSGEISDLRVFVTSDQGVAYHCGSAAAVACYGGDDPGRSNKGTMILSYEDPDIVHTTFHEYGHHMDNQLYNLRERIGCGFDNDGSRRWFFARDLETRILENTTCSPDARWEELLGELYAEDYAQLSAAASDRQLTFDPRMPAGPPSASILLALQRDIDRPFVPRTRKYRGSFRGKTARRRLTLDAPAFIRLTGASEIRRTVVSGCGTPYEGVYAGRCKIRLVKKGRARRYRIGIEIY